MARKQKLDANGRVKIRQDIKRKIGRKIHAEKRLKERFGLEYESVSNIIRSGNYKVVLHQDYGQKICNFQYKEHDIFFALREDEVKTFLTKEMVDKKKGELEEDIKKRRRQKKIDRKRRSKEERKLNKMDNQPRIKPKPNKVLIPASELFGDNFQRIKRNPRGAR
jgi:hypothetical protein